MKLPERKPVQDAFDGSIFIVDDVALLATQSLANMEALYSGIMTLRYGIEYLGKPQQCIMPELVVMDYGDALAGDKAWEFLFERSNLYPRADVVGYRNDGVDDMIVVKWLDLMAPVAVTAFSAPNEHMPLAWVRGFIGPGFDTLPERTQTFLPHFDNLETWQATRNG